MQKDQVHNSEFNDIVFQGRNKEFGAYWIRKGYVKNLFLAFFISSSAFFTVIAGPYIYEKFTLTERTGSAPGNMESMDLEMVEINIPAAELPAPPPPPVREHQPPAEEDLPPEPVEEVVEAEEKQEPDSIKSRSETTTLAQTQETDENNPFDENDTLTSGSGMAFNPNSLKNSQAAFPGGNPKMDEYILKNMRQKHRNTGNTGTVRIGFTILPNGEVADVRVLKGLHVCPECEEDAVRVIKNMPKWTPTISNGYPQKTNMKKDIEYNIDPAF